MSSSTRQWAVGAIGAVLLGTAAGLLSPAAAYADPETPSGTYDFAGRSLNGTQQRNAKWTFSPCGPNCITLNAPGWLQNADFHLTDGRWQYSGPGSMDCPVDHRPLPLSKTVSFDAVTLAGQWTTTTVEACGRGPAGGVVGQWDFRLTKTG